MALMRITDPGDSPVYVDPAVVVAVNVYQTTTGGYRVAVRSSVATADMLLGSHLDRADAEAAAKRVVARLCGVSVPMSPAAQRAERDAAATAKRSERAARLAADEGTS